MGELTRNHPRIASGKTGTDNAFVTGTAGSNNEVAKWDANGDLVTTGVSIDTDGTLSGNSDLSIPTERAVKSYVDSKFVITGGSGGTVPPGPTSAINWRVPEGERWEIDFSGNLTLGSLSDDALFEKTYRVFRNLDLYTFLTQNTNPNIPFLTNVLEFEFDNFLVEINYDDLDYDGSPGSIDLSPLTNAQRISDIEDATQNSSIYALGSNRKPHPSKKDIHQITNPTGASFAVGTETFETDSSSFTVDTGDLLPNNQWLNRDDAILSIIITEDSSNGEAPVIRTSTIGFKFILDENSYYNITAETDALVYPPGVTQGDPIFHKFAFNDDPAYDLLDPTAIQNLTRYNASTGAVIT